MLDIINPSAVFKRSHFCFVEASIQTGVQGGEIVFIDFCKKPGKAQFPVDSLTGMVGDGASQPFLWKGLFVYQYPAVFSGSLFVIYMIDGIAAGKFALILEGKHNIRLILFVCRIPVVLIFFGNHPAVEKTETVLVLISEEPVSLTVFQCHGPQFYISAQTCKCMFQDRKSVV